MYKALVGLQAQPSNSRSAEPLGKVTANLKIFPKRIKQLSAAGGEIPRYVKLLSVQLTPHSSQLLVLIHWIRPSPTSSFEGIE